MAPGMNTDLPHVVIVGGGISGIASGIALKRQLRFTNFTIYEKSSGVGGTWRTSTYPGCSSDIPVHWYSLSSDLNPDWPTHYATQPQILAYWENIWRKHDLPRYTKFETSVLESVWDEPEQLYHVTVRDEKTGEVCTVDAHFIIYGPGGFMAPQYPKSVPFEQVKNFSGPVWHSAEWRHDVDLKGKTVAVIGNGCSGVINFIRSPQWLVPMNNFHYRPSTKWIFRNIPFVMRWFRNLIMARADLEFLIFRKGNRRLREMAVKELTSYIKSVAPQSLGDKLIPDYPVGAKQIIVDPKYLESLSRTNVELQTESIDCIVENGIRLRNGEVIPVDVIVFATGYSIEPVNFCVRGLNGKTIKEYFDEQGGPTAYLGSNFSGFPNLCYIIGPNGATGHASLLFDMETQIELAVQLAAPVIERKIHSLTVKDKVTEDYNTWLQARIATSVWPSCGESYYYVDGTSKTKNIVMFPGPATLFWWFARKPKWSEWDMFGPKGKKYLKKPSGMMDQDLVWVMKLFGAVAVAWASWMVMSK